MLTTLTVLIALAASSVRAWPAPGALHDIRPPVLGAVIPDLQVTSENGQTVALRSFPRSRPTVVVLADSKTCFEGHDCPLGQLHEVLPYLDRAGYQVVYVFGGAKKNAPTLVHDPALSVIVTFDVSMTVARAMGILATNKGGASAKRDARAQSKVIPSVFVVGKDLRIKYEYVAVSPSVPLSGEVLLTAARVYKDAVVRGAPEG